IRHRSWVHCSCSAPQMLSRPRTPRPTSFSALSARRRRVAPDLRLVQLQFLGFAFATGKNGIPDMTREGPPKGPSSIPWRPAARSASSFAFTWSSLRRPNAFLRHFHSLDALEAEQELNAIRRRGGGGLLEHGAERLLHVLTELHSLDRQVRE